MRNTSEHKDIFPESRSACRKSAVYSSVKARISVCVIFVLAFVACLVFGMFDFSTAFADNNARSDNRTVRAGIFYFEGYHTKDNGGRLTGYGISFLNLVSEYSNLNFKYVGYDKSWEEMQTMLANDEIDVVTSARKTPEREELFDFSLPIGRNRTILSIKVDNMDLHRGDYGAYDGMTVGLLSGSSQNQSLAEFAADNGFNYTPVFFDDSDELALALQDGDIDAILSSNLRKSENEKVLDIIEEADFYAIVKKGNTALLDEINYAIEQMDINEGDWKNVLFYQFYGPVYSSALSFTERETKYINEVVSGDKVITVTALGDRAPYSFIEKGVLKGIMPDYFAEVMKLAGLPYEIIVPKNKDDYLDIVGTNKATVVIDSVGSDDVVEDSDYRGFNTNSYMTARMARVVRQDHKGSIKVVAVSDSQGKELIEQEFLEGYTVRSFSTGEEAMRAVLNNEADAAYVYAYSAQLFVNRDSTNSLYYSMMNGMSTRFSMHVGENNDHELVTILNKCIKQMSDETLNQLASKYTTFPAVEMSFAEYLKAHPEIIVIAVLVLVVIVFVILALYLRGRWNKKLLHTTEQANKAKTNFLNSMSHDIRTPMNAIIGFASLAKTRLDDKEQMRNYLGKIMTSGNHLLSLINDVLDMSRIESGKVRIEEKETSLPEIVHDLKTIAQADVKAKQLDFRMEAVNIMNETIICDKLRLNQVLLNILSNAIKYTMPGGAVRVRVAQTTEAAEGKASYEFSVKDTGIGMSSEFLKKVFEPFEREQTSTVSGIQGTGLGLAITKNFVDMMGGTITVDSEEGKGSEFTVKFNFCVVESSIESQRVEKLENVKALVVCDDEAACEAVLKMLAAMGMNPEWTSQGNDAVSRAKSALKKTEPYGMVIVDGQTTDADGISLVRKFRKAIGESTPIVLLTECDISDIEKEAKKSGATSLCTKPIFFSELRNAIMEPYAEKSADEPDDSTSNFDGKRILLVEDNELNQEIAQTILESAGFIVDAASDGGMAVEQVKNMPTGTYDVILMDVQMPVMNGYEATKAIRALDDTAKAEIPIVAMTANAFDEDKKEAMDAGMNGYVSKPIDIDALIKTLNEILA